MKLFQGVILIIVVGLVVCPMWQLGKKINYLFSYESQVEQTIQKKVKAKCLIEERGE